MNYIFYQTKTKFSNTGDALINKALIEVLREYGQVYANCGSNIPEEFLEELGIKPEEKKVCDGEVQFAVSVIKCALGNMKKQNRVYIFSGLGDVHGGGKKRVIRNYISSILTLVYNLLGIKTVRIGRSIGNITKGMEYSERVRSIVSSYNYVRDTQSLERCKSMKIGNVGFCPDMSWLYLNNSDRDINEHSTVVVNMRGSTLGGYEEEYAKVLVPKCGEIIEEIQRNIGGKVCVKFVYQVEEDKKITQVLYETYKDEFDSEIIDTRLKLSDIENVYSEAGYHISNRMHSLLLGYKYGSLPVALIDVEKHLKISSTFVDCKLDELVIDMYKEQEVDKRIENIVTNKTGLYNRLIKVEADMRNEIEKILTRVMDGSN